MVKYMKKPQSTKLKQNDNLKLRMLQAKTMLPREYTSLYLMYYPDGKKDLEKIRRVWNLTQVDKLIVERFEKIAEILKAA